MQNSITTTSTAALSTSTTVHSINLKLAISASLRKPFFNDTVVLEYTSNYLFQQRLQYNRVEYTQKLNDIVEVGLHPDFFYSHEDGPQGGQQKNLDRVTGNLSISF